MAREAVLNVTITKKLRDILYDKAEAKRKRIGDFIDEILFDANSRYNASPVDFRTMARYADFENKVLMTIRCESHLKKMLQSYSERDTGGDMSIAFQMIASNYLSLHEL